LATSKAAYLAALEREALAQSNFKREKQLWEKKITSEQEYIDARQALAKARIITKSAEQQLHALGFSDSYLQDLPQNPDFTLTRFEIRAPISGMIIEKHITRGEKVTSDRDLFTIADLSSVWVDITVYQKDLVNVRKGQNVEIKFKHGIPDAKGSIAFVNPVLDESTRTTFARVVLDNPHGYWRPGLFVTGLIKAERYRADVVIPRSAVIELAGKPSVFVRTEKGFKPREIKLGRTTDQYAEVVTGLRTGEQCAATNVLALKSQINSAALEQAGHGH
jgi:cobalt-zinc-cadmium efflux system membrane fusion protein